MTIHHSHPFADPPSARDAVRAFRGRLPAAVTLWTAAGERRPAGLAVSSVLIAPGEPPRLLALLDPLSDLADALQSSQRAAVTVLESGQRQLAEIFAGLAPAPGGQFAQAAFEPTEWGPVPTGATTWAGLRLEGVQELGWSLLATGVIEQASVGAAADPLIHYRGQYPRLDLKAR